MSAHLVQYRMESVRVEIRTDVFEVDGCTQELFAHAFAVRREEIRNLAIRGLKSHRSVDSAFVDELRRQNLSVTQIGIFAILLFVDHTECVARLNLQSEIDIPSEDIIR